MRTQHEHYLWLRTDFYFVRSTIILVLQLSGGVIHTCLLDLQHRNDTHSRPSISTRRQAPKHRSIAAKHRCLILDGLQLQATCAEYNSTVLALHSRGAKANGLRSHRRFNPTVERMTKLELLCG